MKLWLYYVCLLSKFSQLVIIQFWDKISAKEKNGPHSVGRGQTGKFRSPNIFWPALESFVLPLSTTYLKTSRAAGFAEERYFIEVRPLTN